MQMKKLSTAFAAMALCMYAAGSQAAMKDGTYTEVVPGHNAPMTISVTIKNNRITAIDTSKNLETIGVGRVALEKMSDKIIKHQSLGVDAVTGASLTSLSLKAAVGSCIKKAGGDLKAWQKQVEKHSTKPVTYKGDVVVIGGGGSGLAAAISAHQNGARVVVLEKLGILGGSTNVSEGALNAPDPQRQGPLGIEDSKEKFYEQTMKGGHNIGDPELVRYLTENALDSVHWMEKLGVKFKDTVGTATGALWQRSHYPSTPSGNSYIRVFEQYLAKHKDEITVLTDTTVKKIEYKKGRVTGVVADNKGRPVKVNAKNGVIIATGGFGGNVQLRQEVNTGVWKEVKLDNSIGCTNFLKSAQGEGIIMGKAVGANVIGMSDIQIHPCGTPGTGLMENIRTSGRNRLFINLEGNRFVNEGAARDTLAKAIFAQKDSSYWVVVNHLRYPARDWVDANGATIANMVAQGSVVEADTLEELAKKTGMNVDNLKAAVAGYNDVVQKGAKDKFGFVANNKADKALTEGPWYACRKVPTVHHTMGGLQINTKGQVLNAKGKAIRGLYAAGEVTGGIHGSNRLGGNAIADVMTFGRTAGASAAKGL